MLRLLLSTLLLVATMPVAAPAIAKGPRPAPAGECRPDISGRMQCAYDTQSECLAAARAIRRENRTVQGCWLSTADPNWWHYDRWVLEYYP